MRRESARPCGFFENFKPPSTQRRQARKKTKKKKKKEEEKKEEEKKEEKKGFGEERDRGDATARTTGSGRKADK